MQQRASYARNHTPRLPIALDLARKPRAMRVPDAGEFTADRALQAQPESLISLLRRYEDIFGLFRGGRLCLRAF
jgi:hypothetical protein